jgi:glycosyltransferase involved in cell wall biosynthesis
MKIVYIVDFSVEGNSGKHKATREKALALKALLGDDNVDFYYPKGSKKGISKYLGSMVFDIRLFYKLLFRKGDYKVVMRVLFLPLTRILFYIKGVPVVCEFHADFKEEIPLLNKNGFEKKLLYILSFFFNLNFKLSNGLIFNHPYLKNKFDPILKKKSIYSYNGSNHKDFKALDMQESRTKIGIGQNELVFLFLGSVSQWHGVDYLIDMFNEPSIIANPNIYLYIVGGKRNAYVEGLIKSSRNSNIIFKDPVPSNIAELYINASDYCMLPVKHNRTSPGSPLKLYDYISCGKPVITQENMAGYSDEVLNYNLGFVTDLTQPEAAAKEILRIAQSTTTDSFKDNNIDVAVNKVSWLQRMKAWVLFIKDIEYK